MVSPIGREAVLVPAGCNAIVEVWSCLTINKVNTTSLIIRALGTKGREEEYAKVTPWSDMTWNLLTVVQTSQTSIQFVFLRSHFEWETSSVRAMTRPICRSVEAVWEKTRNNVIAAWWAPRSSLNVNLAKRASQFCNPGLCTAKASSDEVTPHQQLENRDVQNRHFDIVDYAIPW